MQQRAIIALRVCLVALMLGLLVAQVLIIPLLAHEAAREAPEVAYLRWPYTVAAIVVVACVQLAVVCVWRLLGFVRTGSIFSPRALMWVSRIIWSGVAATTVLVVMFVHLSAINAMPPWIFLLLTGGIVGGASLALLLVVMRALLVRATELETDLSEVI